MRGGRPYVISDTGCTFGFASTLLVRAKSVLNMMMCLSAIGVVWVLWLVFGYSMAFGTTSGE